MNKLYFLVGTSLLLILFSCGTTPEKTLSKPVIDEKEFLNHEIINDSIEYRIKEFDQRNQIIRNVCVFKNDELIKEQLIYRVQKKEILDEGYNTSVKKMYEVNEKNTINVYDYTTHYYDYNIESIDTVLSVVIIQENGDIKIQKPLF